MAKVSSINGNFIVVSESDYSAGLISSENLANGYISASGNLVTDAVTKTTDYFAFRDGMSALFLLSCSTGDEAWCAISYFDSDRNFISRYVFATSGARPNQGVCKVLNSVSGASYARLSYRMYAGWEVSYRYITNNENKLDAIGLTRENLIQGGLSGIDYSSYYPYRVTALNPISYHSDKVVFLPRGHKIAYRSIVDGAVGIDSGWHTGFMYLPAHMEFLPLIAKETEDNDIANVDEYTSGLIVCDKYDNNPVFVHGSLSNGAYVANDNRIVNVSYFKFDKMCRITPRDGYKVAVIEYRNDEFYYDYYWRDNFYMPANSEFRLLVKKSDDSAVSLTDKWFDITLAKDEPLAANVISINHRGFWTAPENTIEAFRLSRENGFNYIETDLELTSDGVPVLLHDHSINRTAVNLDGTAIADTVNISDITYAQALGYSFKKGFNWYKQHVKIPTLVELLEFCKFNAMRVYIELKTAAGFSDETIHDAIDTVNSYAMSDAVTWISFNSSYVENVASYDPSARVGYIVSAFGNSEIEFVGTLGNNAFLDAQHEYITEELAEACASAGIRLEAWTINDVEVNELNKYVSGYTNNYWHS